MRLCLSDLATQPRPPRLCVGDRLTNVIGHQRHHWNTFSSVHSCPFMLFDFDSLNLTSDQLHIAITTFFHLYHLENKKTVTRILIDFLPADLTDDLIWYLMYQILVNVSFFFHATVSKGNLSIHFLSLLCPALGIQSQLSWVEGGVQFGQVTSSSPT